MGILSRLMIDRFLAVTERLRRRLARLSGKVDGLFGIERRQVVTYRDAVAYFVNDRPKEVKVASGVLSRQNDPSGVLLIWQFLDTDGRLLTDQAGKPYRRIVLARELDEELAEHFADGELVLFR